LEYREWVTRCSSWATSAWKAWVCFVMVSVRKERKRIDFKWGELVVNQAGIPGI